MLWFTGHDSYYTIHENMDAGDYTVHVELPSYAKLTDFKVVLNEQCELPVHAVAFSRANGQHFLPMNHAFLQIR